MNDYPFSDADLVRAAKSVRQQMINSLPAPSECPDCFSSEFLSRMDSLIKVYRIRTSLWKHTKRIAAIFLAIFLGLSTWLSVDLDARADFIAWVRSICEDSILYHFFSPSTNTSTTVFRPTSIPNGYTIANEFQDDTMCSILYSPDSYSEGKMDFVFEYYHTENGDHIEFLKNDTNYTCETVSINKITGFYYQSHDETESNILIWYQKSDGILFVINSFLSKQELLTFAESIY